MERDKAALGCRSGGVCEGYVERHRFHHQLALCRHRRFEGCFLLSGKHYIKHDASPAISYFMSA